MSEKIEYLIKELQSDIEYCKWYGRNEEEVEDALCTLKKLKEAILKPKQMTALEYLEKENKELIKKLERNLIRSKVTKLMMQFAEEYHQHKLTLTDVGWSEVFTKYGKPFTSGRDLWDWLKDNCKVVLKT